LPWLLTNRPGTRLFYCDPPGRTDPDALFNLGPVSVQDKDYVFFHDQEPVWLDLHRPLFDEVLERNADLWDHNGARINKPRPFGHVVVSERGEYVERMCERYEWTPHYYFYHAWACQDWYRGYDRAFLIARARDRKPTKTFISPNRIVAGKRDHRVLFLYNVFKQKLEYNWISAPRVCAYENVDISTVAQKYCNIYADIEQVFDAADLPRLFPGEDTPVMSSCWLTNFDEAADSLVYVPTETVYFGRRTHITEKTFKAIALEMPFVLVAPAHSLEYLREYGFKTFGNIIDESYDEETNDIQRIEKVCQLLKQLNSLSMKEREQLHRAMLPAVEHNYNHFYSNGLTNILWNELMGMLNGI